jgi:Zn-dependent membrane protease YugP
MFFFHDPFYMMLMLVGGILVFLPQLWVKNTYNHYKEERTARGLTGADVAQGILQTHGLHNVQVEAIAGELTDHYDPSSKTVRLSEDIYYGRSVSATSIAAHEVGHALQHAAGFFPVLVRSTLVPAVNLGSNLGPILFFISIGLAGTGHLMPEWAWNLALFGVMLFGFAVLFHIVTLPVEIDASMRAVAVLEKEQYLSPQELRGGKKVLTAAAMTYVAAALYALIQLAYYILRLLNSNRR